MAIVALSASPAMLDSGGSEFVMVTNTGAVTATVSRGSQSFTLRPGQSRTVYPEGSAVTATVASGTGQVSTVAQAAQVTQAVQVAANTSAIVGLARKDGAVYTGAHDFTGATVTGVGGGGGGSGLPSNVLTKTTTYTAAVGDFVQADASSAGFTVTLPAAPATGALVTVKKTDTTGNQVVVVASGGGAASSTTSTRSQGSAAAVSSAAPTPPSATTRRRSRSA